MSRLLPALRHIFQSFILFSFLPPRLSHVLFELHMCFDLGPFLLSHRFVFVAGVHRLSELLDLVVFQQLFQVLVNRSLFGWTLLRKLTQFLLFLITLFFEGLQFMRGLACLLLDPGEEVDKALRIVLKKLFWASQTHLAHVFVLHQLGNFLVLGLNHMLNEEHFPFLFDKLPPGFTIFRSFNGNIHSASLRHLNFALHFRVDR